MITPGFVFARRPREASRAGASRTLRWRLRPADRAALGIWLASRAVLLIVSLYSKYLTPSGSSSSWLGLWQHWDGYRYLTIAEYGYTSGKGPAYDSNITAFFPGFPLVLRAVHMVVRDWAAAGLLGSLLYDRLHGIETLSRVPTIFMSANPPLKELKKRNLLSVRKPFNLRELLHTIEWLLAEK